MKMVLLTDDSEESRRAREMLVREQVDFQEVEKSMITAKMPPYRLPTLIVDGKAYQGLKMIREIFYTDGRL